MVNIEGRWIGTYSYGQEYPAHTQHIEVPFEAEFKNTLMGFVGKIFEDVETGGIDDEIYVEGEIDRNKISFNKFYTKKHHMNDSGETVTEEDDDDANIVQYEGEFNSSTNKFEGKWTIFLVSQDEDGQDVEFENTGTWEMWRA
jgi:hypothetical protein